MTAQGILIVIGALAVLALLGIGMLHQAIKQRDKREEEEAYMSQPRKMHAQTLARIDAERALKYTAIQKRAALLDAEYGPLFDQCVYEFKRGYPELTAEYGPEVPVYSTVSPQDYLLWRMLTQESVNTVETQSMLAATRNAEAQHYSRRVGPAGSLWT